jgi:hypothetical protein
LRPRRGEQLGEDWFDDPGSLPVEGFAFGGIQPGGHLLPGVLHGGGFAAVAQPPGLAGFLGDGDVQLGLAGGGEIVLAGVPGVEQRFGDGAGDAGGGQVGPGLSGSGCKAPVSAGLSWAAMA